MNNTNAAQWAVGAANTFREVARTTENPTTKQLAEGLTYLAEAIPRVGHEVTPVRRTRGR